MGIEGELRSVTLADICQLLSMGRKTGCLTVTHRTNFGYIYLDQGRVTYATVLNRPDRLGDLLLRNGVIRQEDLDAAVRTQAVRPGMRLGRILVEQGSLSEEDLRSYITLQIEEAVYHLFTWEEGSFHFESDRRPDVDPSLLVSVNVETLLLEGARRVDELSMIEKRIPSRDLVFSVGKAPAGEDEGALTEAQERVLALLDGARTVDEVIEGSGLVEFEVLKGLYGLLQAGFVQEVGRRDAPDEPETVEGIRPRLNLARAFHRAGMLEDAEREYRAVLELDPDEPTALARLAGIALRTGRPDAALAHFERLAGLPGAETRSIVRNHALALELLERHDEALALLDRARARHPHDAELLLARAIVLLKRGEGPEARAAFAEHRAALSEEARLPALHFAYALLASAMAGEVDEAVKIGREGLASHPGCAPILVNLGVVLERKGDTAAAEALYLRAVGQNPPSARAHRNLGDLARARGDQAGARAHYERAVRLDPSLGGELHLRLGNLAYEEGDRTGARHHWEKALELHPDNEVIRTNLDLIASSTSS